MNSKIKLNPGESLRLTNSATKGTMHETDISTFDIIDSADNIVGSVVHTDHTAIRGFRRTQSVRQLDASGRVVVDETW